MNSVSGNVTGMTGVSSIKMTSMTSIVAAQVSGILDTMTSIVNNLLSGNMTGLSGRITAYGEWQGNSNFGKD